MGGHGAYTVALALLLLDRPAAVAQPVFADPTGRRSRRARWAGRAALGLFLGFLLLVGAGMVWAPLVPRVALPGLGPLLPDDAGQPPTLLDPVVVPAPLAAGGLPAAGPDGSLGGAVGDAAGGAGTAPAVTTSRSAAGPGATTATPATRGGVGATPAATPATSPSTTTAPGAGGKATGGSASGSTSTTTSTTPTTVPGEASAGREAPPHSSEGGSDQGRSRRATPTPPGRS